MTARSNHPGGRPPVDKVSQLQRHLWVAAQRSPERRVHALMDRIWRRDVLQEAWRRVKANRGAAGVDCETLGAVEQYGVERMLSELHAALQAGTYRPPPVLRRYIRKPDGRQRPLGIPTVRDRVVQMAATIVLEPIFEADFRASSYGFRPKRSATQALETLRVHGARGGNHVLDADIRDYFGSIDQGKLLKP
jgi:RNA-directed DNA polymerase